MVSQEEILQVTETMNSVQLLDVANSSVRATPRSMGGNLSRPFDVIRSNGMPQNPLPFEAPTLSRGRRDTVLVWTNNEHQQFHDVLFRDDLQLLTTAYWTIPHKEPIKTIMGHVQICVVLRRCAAEHDSDDDEASENECSDDGDIVFQLTSEYVAIKVNYCSRIDALRDRHAEDPMKEIAAMECIGNDHPNVLGYREVLFDGQNINVVMPYCSGGDLFELLQVCRKNPKPGLTEERGRFYMRQILLGVQHLQRKGICHRDLSPENIMMHDDGCVVIDMGMCLRMPYKNDLGAVVDVTKGHCRLLILPQGTCGKLPYMSPEVYANRVPFDGEAVDVWSCGVILFCILTGNRSYNHAHRSDPIFYWMTHGLERLLSDWEVVLSPEGVSLLKGMLQVDPRDRLSLSEVLNHPWFQ
jgi:hypothetical protein